MKPLALELRRESVPAPPVSHSMGQTRLVDLPFHIGGCVSIPIGAVNRIVGSTRTAHRSVDHNHYTASSI